LTELNLRTFKTKFLDSEDKQQKKKVAQLTEMTQSLTLVFRAFSDISFTFVNNMAVICSGENTCSSSK